MTDASHGNDTSCPAYAPHQNGHELALSESNLAVEPIHLVYLKFGGQVVPFYAVGGSVKPADVGHQFGLVPGTVLLAGVRLPTRQDGFYDVDFRTLCVMSSEAQPIPVSGAWTLRCA